MKFSEAQNLLKKSWSEIKKQHSNQGHEYVKIHWNRYVNLLTYMPLIDGNTRVLEIGASILSAHLHKTYNCPATVVYHPLEPEWKDRCAAAGLNSIAVEFLLGSLPVENSSFDLILFNEVMEHFPVHPAFFLCQVIQKLSDKGLLLFTVPNFATSEKRVQLLLGNNPQDMMDQRYIYYAHHREPVMEECRSLINQCGGTINSERWVDLDDNPEFFPTIKRHIFQLYRRRLHPLIHLLFPPTRKYILIMAVRDPAFKTDDSHCAPPLSTNKEYR